MKKLTYLLLIMSFLFSCSDNSKEEEKINYVNKILKLKKEIDLLTHENNVLKDTIQLLKYPAADRLKNIENLIADNKFDEAKDEINLLKSLFPSSEEAKRGNKNLEVIERKIEKIKEEEAKIRALGFKALKETTNFQIEYNKISVGAFSTAKTFSYDSYGDSYYYSTADRDSKYVSARISITSTDKDPNLPMFYAYGITADGDRLVLLGSFSLKFARWEDYGTYLGNYHDTGNDFAKTSTIPFKIGIELNEEDVNNPIFVIVKNENCMIRNTDRLSRPPVSYKSGSCNPDKHLTIEDINNNYTVVKIVNKNKL